MTHLKPEQLDFGVYSITHEQISNLRTWVVVHFSLGENKSVINVHFIFNLMD